MEPAEMKNDIFEPEPDKPVNPLFPFMAIGSLIYAVLYTFFLYKNSSGITYPFFVGGTCLFFFLYLKKSGTAAKKFSIFLTVSLVLLGISTCFTDSWVLLFFNKLGIFLLFFYMVLHNFYQDRKWDISKYFRSIINVTCTSIAFLFRPFTDFADFLRNRSKNHDKPDGKGKYIFFGVLIALPLLFVILLLLCSADAVFSNIFDILLGDLLEYIFSDIWSMIALFLFAFFASYCMMCRLSTRNIKEEVADKRCAEPVIGITFTGIISLVYLIFCFIQIFYLFGGLGTLPEGYTYAKYAREGFFQLVFVCLINLALVLICMKRFRKSSVLKGLLVFISLCTYIMIASSAYRMLLYINVYYLTFLRFLVLWGLCVIFLLISGTMIMIFHEDFPLVKYCVVTVTVMYILFSFIHPDYWIARYNLSHAYAKITNENIEDAEDDLSYRGYTDFYYLRNLSADAAPAIFGMADELGYGNAVSENRWFATYASRLVKNSYDWEENSTPAEGGCLPKKQSARKINFSRQTAYLFYINYYNQHEDFQTWIISYIYNL